VGDIDRMKKMKILFFIHDLMHGGAEKVLINLVNNMDREKYDMTVMTLFDVGVNKQFLDRDIHYKSVFKKVFRGNSFILKLFSPQLLYKFMVKDKYDMIVSYLEGSSTRILSGCLDDSVKKIAWVHSTETETELVKCYRSKKEAVETYQKFNRIVCVSEEVRSNIYELTGMRNGIEVKYNTNESEKIRKQSHNSVDEMVNNDQIKICGVGKIIPIKGFMRLARIHKQLINEGYHLEIYILGVGEERAKIEAYLKENKIENTFHFLGYRENPYAYVAKCDLFVCSSFAEGFSTAATEALIVGTPVVTTQCAGMRELLGNDNEYGVIVENNEAALYDGLKDFLDHPDKLAKYKRMAMERGKIFQTENTVREVEKLFDTVLEVGGV
jgi:glycosyltransferase involved in cell wall biosynthesis